MKSHHETGGCTKHHAKNLVGRGGLMKKNVGTDLETNLETERTFGTLQRNFWCVSPRFFEFKTHFAGYCISGMMTRGYSHVSYAESVFFRIAVPKVSSDFHDARNREGWYHLICLID